MPSIEAMILPLSTYSLPVLRYGRALRSSSSVASIPRQVRSASISRSLYCSVGVSTSRLKGTLPPIIVRM